MHPSFDVLGIGLNATDTVVLVDRFPPYAGKVPFTREMLSPGGQIATAMVSCARLGLRTKYIGTIGSDERGRIQRASLEGTGVDTSALVERPGCPNQSAYIIVDQSTGERTVLWQRPDCLRLQPQEISAHDILDSRWLHIDGYDSDAAEYAASVARDAGIPVSLDVDTVYPDFERVLRNVSHLVASSNWTREWTGYEDPLEALPRLQREFEFQVTAMTLGHYGALAYAGGEWFYSPAFEVPCVDTTGAGDVFHGGFCCAMLAGMGLHDALEFANATAALNCTAFGARGLMATRPDVEALQASSRTGHTRRLASPEIAELISALSVPMPAPVTAALQPR